MAISHDTVIVGATENRENGYASGAAYLFAFDGKRWAYTDKVKPADGDDLDYFGSSVDVSLGVAVIGAPREDENGENSGAAYVFRDDGSKWVEEAKLLPEDGIEWGSFGRSVGISGDTIVVGASRPGSGEGSAYVFQLKGSDWVQQDKLVPIDGGPNDFFGWDVAISGHTVLIGAIGGSDDNGPQSGVAYVFRLDGSRWVQEAKLVAEDAEEGDGFGSAVSLDGDLALIGAVRDVEDGIGSGSAYVFRRDGSDWVQEAKLLSDDGESGDRFGRSVALSDEIAIISAPGDDDNGRDSGSVYVFSRVGAVWMQRLKLLPNDGESGNPFGPAAGLSEGMAIVGSKLDDDIGLDGGAAYLIPLCGACCDEGGSCVDNQLVSTCAGRFARETSCREIAPLCGTGACCGPDGTCEDDVSPEECNTRYVHGVVCEDLDPACLMTGACCDRDGQCVDDVPIDECDSERRFEPVTPCEDLIPMCGTGACCLEDGACADFVPPDDCEDRWVHGAFCDDVGPPCGTGACCAPDGTCIDQIPRGECGTRYEEGSFCADLDPTCVGIGACCSVEEVCTDDVREDACMGFFAVQTLCDDLDPPCGTFCVRYPHWGCDGDVNGDGQVNPVDSGLVQAAFGSRDRQDLCTYDLDCDGQINPVDCGLVLRLFGTCEPPRDPCP